MEEISRPATAQAPAQEVKVTMTPEELKAIQSDPERASLEALGAAKDSPKAAEPVMSAEELKAIQADPGRASLEALGIAPAEEDKVRVTMSDEELKSIQADPARASLEALGAASPEQPAEEPKAGSCGCGSCGCGAKEKAAEPPKPEPSLTGRHTKFRSFGEEGEQPSAGSFGQSAGSFGQTAKQRAENAAAAAGSAWKEFKRSDYAHQSKRMWALFWDTFQNRGWQFSGRANRTEFWVFLVGTLLVSTVLSILSSIPLLGMIAALASLIWWVVTLIPTWAVAFRRLHDTGRSGWWVAGPLLGIMALLFLFPASIFLTVFVLTLSGAILVIGGILFLIGLVFCALPGDEVANQYGEVPEDLHIFN